MNNGFIRVASANFYTHLTNIHSNTEQMILLTKEAHSKHVSVLCFPELCITGYTIEDLFFQRSLINETYKAIHTLQDETRDLDILIVFGVALPKDNALYNCALVMHKGHILGVVPKTHIPNYHEFYEAKIGRAHV